jgi:transposase
MYEDIGRPSIPPEHLLKASLLTILYSIRSERQFCERLQYDLLFKWFLDLNIMDTVFDASSFSKNRQRLLKHQVAREFFNAVLAQARRQKLLSADHFSVDGTLLEAWASLKSFKPRDGGEPPQGGGKNPSVDFHGEQRTNDTHASTTDPEARLAKKGKGKEARLCYAGHVFMENRNGIATDVKLTTATGTAEPDTALEMVDKVPGKRRITLGADKGYDTKDFVTACRDMKVTPHVARRQHSIVDERTTRHEGYKVSLKVRKRIEEIFGWIKTVGGGRKLRYKGIERNQLWAELAVTAYNLVRMAKLVTPRPAQG